MLIKLAPKRKSKCDPLQYYSYTTLLIKDRLLSQQIFLNDIICIKYIFIKKKKFDIIQ